jgi:hypothetical protein
MNDMNHFSSDQYGIFSVPPRRGALGRLTGVATSKRQENMMCNLYAKRRAHFVACSEQNSDSEIAGWIEKPNKRGKLPTPNLGLYPLVPYIPAAEVDSTGRMVHGALPLCAGWVKYACWGEFVDEQFLMENGGSSSRQLAGRHLHAALTGASSHHC